MTALQMQDPHVHTGDKITASLALVLHGPISDPRCLYFRPRLQHTYSTCNPMRPSPRIREGSRGMLVIDRAGAGSESSFQKSIRTCLRSSVLFSASTGEAE